LGRGRIAFSLAFKVSLYVVYESLRPIAMQSTRDAKPNIVDAALSLIFMIRQEAYCHLFAL